MHNTKVGSYMQKIQEMIHLQSEQASAKRTVQHAKLKPEYKE